MEKEQVLRNLKRVFWDMDQDPHELLLLLSGKTDEAQGVDRERLFRRLLETYSWYTVKAMVPADMVPQLLAPDVIARLRNASLRNRYHAICRILYPTALPSAG